MRLLNDVRVVNWMNDVYMHSCQVPEHFPPVYSLNLNRTQSLLLIFQHFLQKIGDPWVFHIHTWISSLLQYQTVVESIQSCEKSRSVHVFIQEEMRIIIFIMKTRGILNTYTKIVWKEEKFGIIFRIWKGSHMCICLGMHKSISSFAPGSRQEPCSRLS